MTPAELETVREAVWHGDCCLGNGFHDDGSRIHRPECPIPEALDILSRAEPTWNEEQVREALFDPFNAGHMADAIMARLKGVK